MSNSSANQKKSTTAAAPAKETVASADWREAMGSFVAGVTVVTCADEEGEYGTTVSAFSSVSMDPPLLLVCMDTKSRTCGRIEKNKKFAINILAEDQKELAYRFASSKIEHQYTDVSYVRGQEGSPLLEGAICQIECRLTDSVNSGDHQILIGAPTNVKILSHLEPLVYVRGGFHGLGEKMP
ncbi:MAG: flavin reductase family protein [Parvibaculaceae bacterium]|nr:flavin reductase family protein [Parvibaculaceae bacterium]